MTAMQTLAKSIAAPVSTVAVLAILYDGGTQLVPLTVAFLVAMATISLLAR